MEAYAQRVRSSPCFICEVVADPGGDGWHEVVAETEDDIAFLSKYPTLLGHVLVALKVHHEQFHALMAENGVLPWTPEQAGALGRQLRAALAKQSS